MTHDDEAAVYWFLRGLAAASAAWNLWVSTWPSSRSDMLWQGIHLVAAAASVACLVLIR